MTTTSPTTEFDLARTLKQLCAIGAPSGHEDRLIVFVNDWLTERGLTPTIDRLGQITVSFPGSDPEANSVLVSAHLDQLGLVVSNVDANGYVKFERLGGVPERVLPGTRIVIHTSKGDVPAVVGLKSHHLTPPEDKYKALPTASLYLDLGADSAAAVEALGVRVGDPCVYEFSWTELDGGRFSTTSLDDRLGVAALLALVERLIDASPAGTVHVAFTTQEEFHVRGTLALIQKLDPDIVINVDVAPAADTPDLAGATAVKLGEGPVLNRLSFHGRGTLGGLIPHPALLEAADAAAAAVCDSFQYEVIIGLINDAAFVPMASGKGIATMGVAIPTRYTHSPIETAQLTDLEQTVILLERLAADCASLNLERPRL
jgi:putative aminopeptidase FrvX